VAVKHLTAGTDAEHASRMESGGSTTAGPPCRTNGCCPARPATWPRAVRRATISFARKKSNSRKRVTAPHLAEDPPILDDVASVPLGPRWLALTSDRNG